MYTYEEIKINPVKAIDNEIAKNPQAHTILPEIRDVIYCLQKEITVFKNKLSKRNMQIKQLRKKLLKMTVIVGANDTTENKLYRLRNVTD